MRARAGCINLAQRIGASFCGANLALASIGLTQLRSAEPVGMPA